MVAISSMPSAKSAQDDASKMAALQAAINHSPMVQADALVSLRRFTVFQKNLVLQICNYGCCLPWLPSFVSHLPIDGPDYGNVRSSRQMCPLI
jgi:hypothetical protein